MTRRPRTSRRAAADLHAVRVAEPASPFCTADAAPFAAPPAPKPAAAPEPSPFAAPPSAQSRRAAPAPSPATTVGATGTRSALDASATQAVDVQSLFDRSGSGGESAMAFDKPGADDGHRAAPRRRPRRDERDDDDEIDAEVLDDDAFFATLREAVHDETPLGPRDEEASGEDMFFDQEAEQPRLPRRLPPPPLSRHADWTLGRPQRSPGRSTWSVIGSPAISIVAASVGARAVGTAVELGGEDLGHDPVAVPLDRGRGRRSCRSGR